MTLVFQYGSNMDTSRLNGPDRLCGEARALWLVRTAAPYQLWFEVWSNTNGCAAANIRPGGQRRAMGVLYDIPDHLISRDTAGRGRKSLDAIEGEGTNYLRRSIELVGYPAPNAHLEAVTYTAILPQIGLPTSDRYVYHILTGLRQHGAPAEYISYVKAQALLSNPALAAVLASI